MWTVAIIVAAWGALALALQGARNRQYKSGTASCFMRWTFTDSGYITRLHVIKTPWFAVCLHWINHPDPEPYLHDHPVSFLSIILRGGYVENRRKEQGPIRILRHRWFNWINASTLDRHTIVEVKPGTLTLALMGPKVREWGYHMPNGWVHWKTYHHAQRAERAATKANA